MKEKGNNNIKKENKDYSNVYRNIFIVIITAGITFILTTILITYLVASDKLVIKDPITNNIVSASTFDKFNKTLDIIKNKYISKDLDMNALEENAIKGMLYAVGDKYTRYISKEEYEEMMAEGTGEYIGIGIVVIYDKDKNCLQINNVTYNSPADKAGLIPTDIIIKIGDEDVNSENHTRLVDLLKDENNNEVKLTIKRDQELINIVVNKSNIEATSIYHRVLNDNIGYIQITGFNNQSGKQFKDAYNDLISKNVKGLILDLRNNPGGILSETMEIAEVLLPQGIVMYTEDRGGSRVDNTTKIDDMINIPFAVLVNSKSASASEVTAGAIKDFGVGKIIGNKTYGKGIVQSIYEFSDGSALSYTYSEYHTKSGAKINGVGIIPDIEVSLPDEYKDKTVVPEKYDTQLQAAQGYINNK